MKPRKKFNEIYKGLFNQEKKSDPILNESSNHYKKQDDREKDVEKEKEKDKKTQQKLNTSSNNNIEVNKTEVIQPVFYKHSFTRINKFIKTDRLFLLKRQFICDIFLNHDNEQECLFSNNINSLFLSQQRKENISFMKDPNKNLQMNKVNSGIFDFNQIPVLNINQDKFISSTPNDDDKIRTKLKNNYMKLFK